MFIDNLLTVMTNDSSLNEYVTGGIVYEHLPIDFDANKDWVVFSYIARGNTDTLQSNNVISEYNLEVQTISKSIVNTINMADRLINYLVNVHRDASSYYMGDIILEGDSVDINTEKDVYFRTMNFGVIYINNNE